MYWTKIHENNPNANRLHPKPPIIAYRKHENIKEFYNCKDIKFVL